MGEEDLKEYETKEKESVRQKYSSSNTVEIRPYISVIIMNINGLNALVKIQILVQL